MKLSIISTAYNEAENLGPLHAEIKKVIPKLPHNIEIIIVNDGSTDRTAEVLEMLSKSDPALRIISLETNSGQSFALKKGIDAAKGEILVFLDADLQNDPADIPVLLEKMKEGYELVCGWRKDRKDSYLGNTLPSKIGNSLIRTLFGVPIHDTGCSLKACKREAIKDIRYFRNFHRYIPVILAKKGINIGEAIVNHRPRIKGESKYSTLKSIRVIGELIYLKLFF